MELETVKKQVIEVLSFSQQLENCELKGVDKIIEDCYSAKLYFINAFGGWTYESPNEVTMELSHEEKEQKFQSFIDNITFHYDGLTCYNLITFLNNNGSEAFFNNSVTIEYQTDAHTIKPNEKLLKTFKYFFDDTEMVQELQTRASMIIQESKIKGRLCLSVHPLDFLSSSETTFKWRSCQALDGDFRGGNLSYMLDRSTIICYLKSDEDAVLPRFPESVKWNNKKWRMLLFLSEAHDAMFAGRQYPFNIDSILEKISTELFKLLKFNNSFWSAWHNDYIDSVARNTNEVEYLKNQYAPINGMLYTKKQIISDAAGSLHFNDLLISNVYTKPYYKFHISSNKKIKFNIGNSCPCVLCGKSFISHPNTFLCDNCLAEDPNNQKCESCGRYYDMDLMTYLPYLGVYLCESCADEEVCYCSQCGEPFYNDDVHLTKYGEWLCDNCLSDD